MRVFPYVATVLWLGCAGARFPLPIDPFPGADAWHFSEVIDEGDARRRASNRLVGEALSDEHADTPRAVERIRRALQVDPTNPWAYLALAREQVGRGEYRAAWESLDQSEARARNEGEIPLGVRAHLNGLRGRTLIARQRPEEALPLLAEAEHLSPAIWSDQHLNADELR